MNNVENRIVEMKFDNEQFEAAVAKTMDTLDKFKQKLNFEDAGKGMEKLGKASSNYQYSLNDIGQSLDQLNGRFSAMGTIGRRVLENLTDKAVNFATKGIGGMFSGITSGGLSRAMNLEQARFQMQGIYKDASKVKSVIYDDILPELQGTPYSLDQAAVVIGQLGASGIQSSEQIREATRAIAGLAAMSGRGFDEVGRIFSKVAGQGNMMGGELQQLSSYGINAAADISKYFQQVDKGTASASDSVKQHIAEIADAYGDLSEGTIREAASKRMIHYEDMAAAMDTLYGEHAKKSTEMYTGALEDLKAALARIGAEPAAVGLEVLRNAFNALVPAVDAVNAVLKPFTNATKGIVKDANGDDIFGGQMYGKLAKEVQGLGIQFANLFVQMDENGKITRWTDDSIKQFTKTVTDADGAVHHMTEWGQDVSSGDAIMNPAMWRTITAATQSFVNVLKAVRNVIEPIAKGIAGAFPKLTLEAIANMTEGIERFTSRLILSGDNMERLRWITQGIFTPISLAFQGLVALAKGLIKVLANVYQVISPVLNAMFAFAASVGKTISGMGDAISYLVSDAAGFAKFIAKIVLGIAQFLRSDKALGLILAVFTKLSSIFDTAGDKIRSFASNAIPRIHDFIKSAGEMLRVKEAVNAVKTIFENLRSSLSKAFHIEGLSKGFKQFTDTLKDLFKTDNLFGKLLENLQNFLKWLGDLVPYQKIVEKVSGAFDRLATSIGKLTKKPAGAIKQFFIDRANDIKEFIKNLDEGGAFTRIFYELDQKLQKLLLGEKLKGYFDVLKKAIIPVLKELAAFVPKLFGFKTLGDMLQSIASKAKAFISVFLEFVGLVGGLARAKTSEQVSKLSDSLSNLFDTKILSGAKSLGKSLSMTGEGFAAGLVKIGEWIRDTLTNMSPASIKKFIYTITLLIMAYKYMGMLRSLKWAGEAFAGLLKNFGSLMNGLSSGFGLRTLTTAIANTVKLTGLAMALLIFAGAVFILGKMDWKTVLLGSGVLLAAMASYIGVMAVINKLDVDKNGAEKVRNLALSMAAIGGGCLLLVEAVKQLSSIWDRGNPDKLLVSLVSVIGLMWMFVLAAKVLAGIEGQGVAMGKAAFAIIGIAQGMKMMAEACEAFGKVDPNNFEQGLTAIIMIMGFFSLFAASVKAGAKVFSAAAGMMVMAAALMLIQKVLNTFGQMDPKILEQGGNAVGTILAGLSAFALIVGRADKSIFGAALGMVAVAGSIMLIAEAMNKIGSLNESQFAQALASLITIFVGFSAIAKYSGGAKGAAAGGSFLMMAAGILALAYALQVLASANPLALLGGMAEMIVMCAAVAAGIAILKVAIESLDLEDAANLALIGAGLFLLASAIGTLAAVPLAALAVAILGLAGALIVIGLAMSVFSAIGPGLLVVAGAFALLGVAALFVGAGLMFLTLALASLIPLILSLSVVDQQALIQGLQVLGTVAKSLADMFFTLAKGVLAFGGACIVAGVGLVVIGLGLAAIGVGAGLAALGVALFAGALALLAITIQKFFGGGLLEMIAGGFESFAGGFGGLVKGLWNKIKGDSVKEAGTTGEEMGKAMQDGAVKGATSKQDQVTDALTGGPEDALSEIQGMYPEFSTSGGDLNSMLTQGFGDGTPLSDALGGDLSQFSSLLGNQELDAYMKANGISSALGDGYDASGFMRELEGTKQDVSKKLGTIPGVASKQGAATGAGLASGENSKRSAVKSAAASLGTAATPPDKSATAKSIGNNIALGLARGIGSGASAVKTAAQNAVNNAIAAARKSAQVHSPSRKMMRIGRYMSQGLAIGIEQLAKDVARASENVTNGGINAASTAMSQIANTFDADLDFTPTITPVVDLSEVRQGAAGINSMLGGDFGLTTPYSGFINAQMAAVAFQNGPNPAEFEAINKLAKEISSMNETMNARQLVNNIHIEGSEDPNAFADRLTRRFRLNARTI